MLIISARVDWRSGSLPPRLVVQVNTIPRLDVPPRLSEAGIQWIEHQGVVCAYRMERGKKVYLSPEQTNYLFPHSVECLLQPRGLDGDGIVLALTLERALEVARMAGCYILMTKRPGVPGHCYLPSSHPSELRRADGSPFFPGSSVVASVRLGS